MGRDIRKIDWLTLLLCLLLGILAEESFFRGQIGISYIIFMMAFYSVFFWRYRRFPFTHQRLGYLIVCCIWLLSASYVLNDNLFFYVLNILAIPSLVMFHLILVTSPKQVQWNQPVFITYLFSRLLEALKYLMSFSTSVGKLVKTGVKDDKWLVWKKIMIGVVISIPVLLIVLRLLISADHQFKMMIGDIPSLFRVIDAESLIRLIVIFVCMVAFFGILQVLAKKQIKVYREQANLDTYLQFDSVIVITVLIIINMVYILFTIVQFKYFFSGSLQGNLTYAEYARKGFIELIFVTLINLTITITVVTFSKRGGDASKFTLQLMLTILVLASTVMLSSAFLRLSMYEDAYGFTFTRVLCHSFMIFLAVIFTYTLVKIWVEKISLFHFYFISSLLYYTVISVIDLDRIVVSENVSRFEQTGKIDVNYLNSLSATGVNALIDLYEDHQNIPDLQKLLMERQTAAKSEHEPWQSYNLKREHVTQRVIGLKN